jgi:hypothetical protein
MENYASKFGSTVRDEDIVLGGYNFGSGFCEQAATLSSYLQSTSIHWHVESKYSDGHRRFFRWHFQTQFH